MNKSNSRFHMLAAVGVMAACAWQTYQASASGEADPIQRLSHIETTVEDLGGGVFKYNYRVVNDSPGPQWIFEEVETWPSIVGYEIPLDHPGIVWDVTSPATWDHRFLSAFEYEQEYGIPNPFLSAYVLQWYDAQFFSRPAATMIVPEGFNARFEANEYEPFANGFSMLSNLSPVDGPYAALWVDFVRNIGDPPLPGGGITGGALPYRIIPEVPAQGVAALGCLGLALALSWRRRRS